MKKPTPFGKYLLLDRINVGGMAEVFLAKSFGVEGFERLVAIKKILPTMVEDEEFITMFIDEARIAVQLNHANVVQIYELGKHDENYFIAMEYVPGRDLRTLLDRAKRQTGVMPLGQAVYVAQKMCEGLDYAHRKKDARGQDLGIIHRDVSPQNVLVSFEGEVKLIDFGIAKAANRSQKTQAGILKGKFGYMSPEQVRGLPIDRRSDIFAVGVCLYEMLTGEKLFVSESDFSTLEKVRNAEVPPPREVNADVPAGLEEVVLKSLARDVEERYQWASDLQEDLMRFLLLDGRMFGAKQLSHFMQDDFKEAIEAENSRMEQYSQVVAPAEMDDVGTASQTVPGLAVKPEEAFGEPPPEMLQAASDDATQLFDPTSHFAPEQDTGEDAAAEAEPPAAPLEDEDTAGGGLETDSAPGDDDEVTPNPDQVDGHLEDGSLAPEIGENEETATPDTSAPRSGPLGDPGAERHQSAVGRFAAEIPSVPDGRIPDEPELMEGDTRITMTGEGPGLPKSGRSRPSVENARVAEAVRPSPPVVARRSGTPEPRSSGGGKKVLLGLGGAVLVIFAVLTAVFVGMGTGKIEPGVLVIMTSPESGIEILVDDRLVATESPHVITPLAAGRYSVAIRRPGTRDRDEKLVELVAGETEEVFLRLGGDDGEALADAGTADQDGGAAADDVAEPDTTPEPVVEEEPVRLGQAIIRSSPRGATVTQDDERVGTTPLTLEGLALDEEHRYVVSMEGYRDDTVLLRFGDEESLDLTARLERIPPPPPPPPPTKKVVAQQTRQPRSGGGRRPVTETRPAGRGTLIAMTNPVAQVLVNGRDSGRWTPVAPNDPLELPAGDHTITFRADDGRTHVVRVTIQPNQQSRLVGISF